MAKAGAKKTTISSPVRGTLSGVGIDPGVQPINKWLWFKLSRSWVEGAEDRLQKQVDSIQSAIKWFFGLGSSATILSVFFKDPHFDKTSIILFASAVFILFVSFALSTLAISIISRTIDQPNSEDSIRTEFNKWNKRSKKLLLGSSIGLIIGMALFPPGLVISLQNSDAKKTEATFSAACTIVKQNDDNYITDIDISGYTPDSSSLKFRLENGQNLLSAVVVDSLKHILDHSHFDMRFHLEKPVKVGGPNYYLTLIYQSGKDSLHTSTVKLRTPDPVKIRTP